MKFEIETRKTKEEIIQILLKNTSEQRGIGFRNYDKFFSGKVGENSFKIYRNIRYRNSFLPIFIGNIEESKTGCKICIKTRMVIFVIIFLSVWFTGIIGGCLAMPVAHVPIPQALFPYVMLIF